jgi:glucosamine--fructose-6-phosphate aminotransferase (isomerizing)
VWHRRRRQHAQHRSGPRRRPEAAGIPRLRLLRRGRAPGRRTARARSTSRVAELEANVASDGIVAGTGIAHTRWATHGAPAVHNAHPHFSAGPGVDAAATGFGEPRRGQRAAGASAWCTTASSRTTTNCAPNCSSAATSSPARPTPRSSPTWCTTCTTATCSTPCSAPLPRLRGAYAIAVFCRDEPQRVVGAREGSPLVLGVGADGRELPGQRRHGAGRRDRPDRLPGRRRRGRPAAGQDTGSRARDAAGRYQPVQRPVRTVHAHSGAAELGPYRHYMQKEIFEQPRAIADTLEGVAGITPRAVRRRRLPRSSRKSTAC